MITSHKLRRQVLVARTYGGTRDGAVMQARDDERARVQRVVTMRQQTCGGQRARVYDTGGRDLTAEEHASE